VRGEIGAGKVEVLQSEATTGGAFTSFVEEAEPRIRQALTAALGSELAVEATADALAYGWEHWDRVKEMENPIGFLYVLGRNAGRRMFRRRPVLYEPPVEMIPNVEPGLVAAIAALPERQRVTVMMLFCFEWTMSEVADVLGLKKTTVQNHAERALVKLRRSLGVET